MLHPFAQGGLADQRHRERRRGVHVVVGEHADRVQLLVVEQVRFIDHDGRRAPFVDLRGQRGGRLGGESGQVELGSPAQAGDDPVIEAAHADLGVGLVDHREPGRVERRDGTFEGDRFAGSDLAGDQADRPVVDAPGDAGGGFPVGMVLVGHGRGQVAAERDTGETEVPLNAVDHRAPRPSSIRDE